MAKAKSSFFGQRNIERLESKSLLTSLGITSAAEVQLSSPGETNVSLEIVSSKSFLVDEEARNGSLNLSTAGADIVVTGYVDGDGQVGFRDFLDLAANFGAENVTLRQGDVDGDGTVGFKDFIALAANFGATANGVQPEESLVEGGEETGNEENEQGKSDDGQLTINVGPLAYHEVTLNHIDWNSLHACLACGMG